MSVISLESFLTKYLETIETHSWEVTTVSLCVSICDGTLHSGDDATFVSILKSTPSYPWLHKYCLSTETTSRSKDKHISLTIKLEILDIMGFF